MRIVLPLEVGFRGKLGSMPTGRDDNMTALPARKLQLSARFNF